MARATRQHRRAQPTPAAKKFDGCTSVKQWRVQHTKLAKGCQGELIGELKTKIGKLEHKALALDPSSDESIRVRGEIRSLRETLADIEKTPLMRPRDAMRMGY